MTEGQLNRLFTVADVIARVGRVAELAGDSESAHSAEDELHRDVLKAIELGIASDPQSMARQALRTLELDFERWYA